MASQTEKTPVQKYKAQLRPYMAWLDKRSGLVGCEIGIQRGLNARVMLEVYDIEMLYLVEAYRVYPVKVREHGTSVSWEDDMTSESHMEIWNEARQNLMPYQDRVRWLIGWSFDMARHILDGSLDFVYIDGDHSYEGCLEDIRLFYPKVRMGGLVAGHDCGRSNNGVDNAIDDFFGRDGKKNVRRQSFNWWYQKPSSLMSKWGMTHEEVLRKQGIKE